MRQGWSRPVGLLIGAYAAVVLAVLSITPLWLDELQQLVTGRDSVAALMRWVQVNPGASPLPYLIQRAFIDLFGGSRFVVRLPAALCSIAAVAVFARLCPRFGVRPVWGAALFMILPLQFRYAIEARSYSLGLLCMLVSLVLFLRVRERGRAADVVWYGVSVAIGVYSQPLTLLPVAAELVWLAGEPGVGPRTKRGASLVACCATCVYVPWEILQRRALELAGTNALYFFAWRQVTPLGFLHELSGGGLVCSAALLIAAGVGMAKVRHRVLAWWMIVIGLAAPVAIDALVNYFFAARQLLFAAPALVLCAAAGVESLRSQRRRWIADLLLLVFAAAATVSDYRLASVPKDSFGAQAAVIRANLAPDACVAIAPPSHIVYYRYLVPQTERRICASPPDAPHVLALISPYSTVAERERLSATLERGYDRAAVLQDGSGQVLDYRRHGP